MKITFKEKHFFCECKFDQRTKAKSAGFRWHPTLKLWYTLSHKVASRLIQYCDDTAKTEINRKQIVIKEWTRGLCVAKGETLKEFQKEACLFALARNRSYLALDPGLGKTIIAATIAETLSDSMAIGSYTYICPPFLVENAKEEFKRFAPLVSECMQVVSDTQLDLYSFCLSQSNRRNNLVLFVDEAHRFKNAPAQRTRSLFGFENRPGIADYFDKIVYLSGTPMPNRPIELFTILSHSAPETIDGMDYFEFGKKYCNGFRDKFGWDFSGASNVKELVDKVIPKFMLRIKKDQVLKELPPKTEEIIILSDTLSPKMIDLDSKILKQYSPEDLIEGKIRARINPDSDSENDKLHIATYRKELGREKLTASCEFIKDILDNTDESILIFAIHKDTIKGLENALCIYHPLIITGETPMDERHVIVKEFQTDKTKRVFIGNIQAAGLGITLTKATRVIFVEFSWCPSDNDQAADRSHRIGQHENVLVQYLVFQNSIDKAVIETILRKRKVINQL